MVSFLTGTKVPWLQAENAGEPCPDVHAFAYCSTGERQGTHQAPVTLGDETSMGTAACANAPPLRCAESEDRGSARPRRAGVRDGPQCRVQWPGGHDPATLLVDDGRWPLNPLHR